MPALGCSAGSGALGSSLDTSYGSSFSTSRSIQIPTTFGVDTNFPASSATASALGFSPVAPSMDSARFFSDAHGPNADLTFSPPDQLTSLGVTPSSNMSEDLGWPR
eukprot:CAMPEP_0177669424 /NCGR_PEP_ID=MMETSP0447-20121125/23441_1 /TAXON_ID=0 /ORGANISM="Stygamoeba regulata, Strain BSH-02190019" /LENGTH=105 /DNA_ID=CAMNT_0019176305 /DNA_START=27 /DNA_END=344 /DNA_ORIENTATION=-